MSIESELADNIRTESDHDPDEPGTPGTMVLALTLLVCFAVYYFANWKALTDVWPVH